MSKYERLPKSNKTQRTAINYMNSSKGMTKEIEERMIKRPTNNIPYDKVDRHIKNDNNKQSILTYTTSQDFLNRNHAPLRDQLKNNKNSFGQRYNPKNQAKILSQIGRIKKDETHNMIGGNMVRGEDILRNNAGTQGGDDINITIPQDQPNKTTHMNDARQIWQPYDKEKYIRVGDVLQRGQSVLISANRLLLTQPFARIYTEYRRKGQDHENAYKLTINEQIEHHRKKDHELFDPYVEAGLHGLEPQQRKIIEITEKIKENGDYGKVITNLNKIDPEKLHNLAQILA